jgi:hypothetical protein
VNCSSFRVVAVCCGVTAVVLGEGVRDRRFDAAILLARTSTPPDGTERELSARLFVCGDVSGDVDLLRLSAGASAFALISPCADACFQARKQCSEHASLASPVFGHVPGSGSAEQPLRMQVRLFCCEGE